MSSKFNYTDRQAAESFLYDSAMRQRISQGRIWGDYKHLGDKQPGLFDEVTSGTGAATLSNNMVNMTVGANSGDYCLRKTFSPHPYRAGFSMMQEFTFTNFHVEANTEKEFGYFTTATTGDYSTGIDGYRILMDGTTHRLQIYIAGELLYDVPRSDWKDKLDGMGESRINYDFEKFTIVAVDWLWLGGKGMRFWIFIPSVGFYNFHTINHAGTEGATGVFMKTPQHPVRYGLRSKGGSGTFTMICSSVITEGNHSEAGYNVSVNTGNTLVSCPATTTKYAVLGIRHRDGYSDAVLLMDMISALAATNDDFIWEIIINPTIAGPARSWTEVTTCAIEYAIGASAGTNTVTGGSVQVSGISASSQSIAENVTPLTRLGSYFDGTKTEIWLVVRPLSINLDLSAAISMRRL